VTGAEARGRKPRYKEYKRVWAAQNFAVRLGVPQVDYGGRIDMANVVNHGLFLAQERGVPMPAAIRVRPFTEEEGDRPDEMAYYACIGGAVGEIDINATHPGWQNIGATMRRARARNVFSSDDPRHPILHEMGELAMHQSVGADRFDPFHEAYQREEEAFRAMGDTGELDAISDAVSDRATDNHSEFIAEVFAALLLGRDELRDNQLVMENFRRFGGDRLVAWTGE
jgi:hypothetical protein